MENKNVCKVLILEGGRRLLHQEPIQERMLHHKKPTVLVSGFKRCLFGKCDPEDTRKLLEEQYQLDQKRFLAKFGFDIEMVENMERSLEFCKENIETGRKCPRKVLKARRKMSFANNKTQAGLSQQFITGKFLKVFCARDNDVE